MIHPLGLYFQKPEVCGKRRADGSFTTTASASLSKQVQPNPHGDAEQGQSADQASRAPTDQHRTFVCAMNLGNHLGSVQAGLLDAPDLLAKLHSSLFDFLGAGCS
jgi:hypothetical protein